VNGANGANGVNGNNAIFNKSLKPEVEHVTVKIARPKTVTANSANGSATVATEAETSDETQS